MTREDLERIPKEYVLMFGDWHLEHDPVVQAPMLEELVRLAKIGLTVESWANLDEQPVEADEERRYYAQWFRGGS